MTKITPSRVASVVQSSLGAASSLQGRERVLDVARLGQVVTQHPYLLEIIADSMAPIVSRVFGDLSTVFALTCPRRRQVYFAVLAKLERDGRLSGLNDADRVGLVARLLSDRNEALIEYAYPSNPVGFLSIVTALGDTARAADVYLDLHDLLDGAPDLAAALRSKLQGAPLSDTMLELLRQLPREADSVELAAALVGSRDANGFIAAYRVLTGLPTLSPQHRAKLLANVRTRDILEDVCLSLPFPEPIIHGIADIEYIRNGRGLKEAGLGTRACSIQARLQNRKQSYLKHLPDGSCAQFDLCRDEPFGWYLDDIETNHLDSGCGKEINEYIASVSRKFGISRRESFENKYYI